jgi:hypothetical protein
MHVASHSHHFVCGCEKSICIDVARERSCSSLSTVVIAPVYVAQLWCSLSHDSSANSWRESDTSLCATRAACMTTAISCMTSWRGDADRSTRILTRQCTTSTNQLSARPYTRPSALIGVIGWRARMRSCSRCSCLPLPIFRIVSSAFALVSFMAEPVFVLSHLSSQHCDRHGRATGDPDLEIFPYASCSCRITHYVVVGILILKYFHTHYVVVECGRMGVHEITPRHALSASICMLPLSLLVTLGTCTSLTRPHLRLSLAYHQLG